MSERTSTLALYLTPLKPLILTAIAKDAQRVRPIRSRASFECKWTNVSGSQLFNPISINTLV